jgi:anti-sigma factor (TIGR02949 family)
VTNATSPCAEYEADLSALLDGELDTPSEAVLRAHLESCAGCSRRARALQGADEALRGLPSREAPADLRARLQARLEAETDAASSVRATRRVGVAALPPRRRPRSRARPAALLAMAAAAALALYLTLATGERAIPGAQPPASRLAKAADLEAASPDELELALELETVEDMEVIANLELLELLVAFEEGTG